MRNCIYEKLCGVGSAVFVSFTALSDVALHFPNKRIQNAAPSLNAGVKETNTAMRKFQEIWAVFKF